MAKRIVVFLVLLLTVSLCFAGEVPRGSAYSSAGKTTLTNLELTGLDNNGTQVATNPRGGANPGTPAYIEMTNSLGKRFYLWIDMSGRLRIASEVAVSHTGTASPSAVAWADASGVVVGPVLE